MITQDSIQFGTTRIAYDIAYSPRRKNATLIVYPLKDVEIVVPSNLEQIQIQRLVRKKASWILKQLAWFDHIIQIDSVKEYVNGETFLYLGRQYRLKILKGCEKAHAKISGRYLIITLPEKISNKEKNFVKAALWHLYTEKAKNKIEDSIKYYCKTLGMKSPNIRIKHQYKRWGSCTSKNTLNFNIRLIMAPISQINYVIAHELCHLKIKNHSPKFWELLRTVMPDYEQRKQKLLENGWQYVL